MTNYTHTNRLALFEERKKRFDEHKLALQNHYNLISTLRISFFIIGIIAMVYFANEGRMGVFLTLLFLFPILFGFFIKYHNKKKYQLNHAAFIAKINDNEIQRLNLNLKVFDPGEEFIDYLHPYSSDLSIFGNHSLFQLVNRAVTSFGKSLLAKNLSSPLKTVRGIKEKQDAVKELAEKLEWRQDFEARGFHEKPGKNSQKLLIGWINTPVGLKNILLLKGLSFLLPLAFLFFLIGFFTLNLPGFLLFLSLLLNGIVLAINGKVVSDALDKTEEGASILKTYSSLLEAIEQEEFHSDALKKLKEKINSASTKASAEIKKLSSIVENLEFRKNPYFFSTINLIFLWELHWILRLHSWKATIKDNIAEWLESATEFEVLNSLAGLSFSHPELIFPEIMDHEFIVEGTSVNHPLIPIKKRVENDIAIKGLGKIHVITGSNMSGKSTYMRTIGINSVLALIGAPVLARTFSISPMEVFTCMHVHDSLEEETSSFYAELKRIRQLITQLQEPKPVLFLLDELLKGTNSVDRNLGAQALIRQLHKRTGSGLISTHDLELGKMEEEIAGSVKNYSFNSAIINNEIIFDYKLKDGICHSFNASKLMEKMGIELTENTSIHQ